jgi:HipA-like kinase
VQARLSSFRAATAVAAAAETFLGSLPGSSRACRVLCDDKRVYAIKGKQIGRAVCNDQIVARLGVRLGAPVAQPALIMVPDSLVRSEPQMAHFSPGLAHGSAYSDNHTDKAWVSHTTCPDNRERFAYLAVLYGWAAAGDRQLIYSNTPPHLVLSVDHGHFFPGGPNWSVPHLVACPPACVFQELVTDAGLNQGDLRPALNQLQTVTEDCVLQAVAAPPDDWGMDMTERVALAEFLLRRRNALLVV